MRGQSPQGGGVGGGGGATLFGTYAARPAPGTAGRRYVCSNPGIVEFLDDGTAWRPLIYGTIGTEAAPGNVIGGVDLNISGLSGAANVGVAGVACLELPNVNGGTANLRGRLYARAAGKSITAFLKASQRATENNSFTMGLFFRKSSTAAITAMNLTSRGAASGPVSTEIEIETWTDPNTFGSLVADNAIGAVASDGLWLRMRDDGTNVNCETSADGVNWVPAVTTATFQFPSSATFDGCGYYCNPIGVPVVVDVQSLFIG